MIMKVTQLPLKERLGLMIAIGLMVLLVFDAIIIKPAVRTIRHLDGRIVSGHAELVSLQGVLRYADSVGQQYMDVKDVLGVSGPEAETIELFKNELDELALRYGVQLRSMRHVAPESTDHLLTYVIEVGDYEAEMGALLRFLDAIRAAPGLVRVRQLTISSQSANTQVNGSMSVTRVMTQMPAGGEL
ncbi:MAG: hypothetical protein ACNA71_00955 [Kiritimatiellia bacterium]